MGRVAPDAVDDALATQLTMDDQPPQNGETLYLGAESTGVGPFSFLFDNVVCNTSP